MTFKVELTSLFILFNALFAVVQATQSDMEILSGAELYHEYCSVCHGDKGDGNSRARAGLVMPPRDFTQPDLAMKLTRQRMIDVILNGIDGTPMVGWKSRLSHKDVENVVDFIRDNFMSHETVTSYEETKKEQIENYYLSMMEKPMPNKLIGNIELGEKFFLKNCATCHGVKGDGNGPRAFFIVPRPRNFLTRDSRTRLNRPALFSAIKHGVIGKEMPAWGKVLTDQQIANITEFVFIRMITQPVD